MRLTRRIAVAGLMAVALATPAFADDKPTILASVPGLTFPFFVHMMNAFKAEGAKLGVQRASRATARSPRPSRPPTSRRR